MIAPIYANPSSLLFGAPVEFLEGGRQYRSVVL